MLKNLEGTVALGEEAEKTQLHSLVSVLPEAGGKGSFQDLSKNSAQSCCSC